MAPGLRWRRRANGGGFKEPSAVSRPHRSNLINHASQHERFRPAMFWMPVKPRKAKSKSCRQTKSAVVVSGTGEFWRRKMNRPSPGPGTRFWLATRVFSLVFVSLYQSYWQYCAASTCSNVVMLLSHANWTTASTNTTEASPCFSNFPALHTIVLVVVGPRQRVGTIFGNVCYIFFAG